MYILVQTSVYPLSRSTIDGLVLLQYVFIFYDYFFTYIFLQWLCKVNVVNKYLIFLVMIQFLIKILDEELNNNFVSEELDSFLDEFAKEEVTEIDVNHFIKPYPHQLVINMPM